MGTRKNHEFFSQGNELNDSGNQPIRGCLYCASDDHKANTVTRSSNQRTERKFSRRSTCALIVLLLALSTEQGNAKVRTRVKFVQGINIIPQSVTNIIPQSITNIIPQSATIHTSYSICNKHHTSILIVLLKFNTKYVESHLHGPCVPCLSIF